MSGRGREGHEWKRNVEQGPPPAAAFLANIWGNATRGRRLHAASILGGAKRVGGLHTKFQRADEGRGYKAASEAHYKAATQMTTQRWGKERMGWLAMNK